MQSASCSKRIMAKILGYFLAIAMVFTMMPLTGMNNSYAATSLETQTPEIVVTGTAVIGNDGVYSATNTGMEKSYTRNELKAMEDQGQDILYSGIKTKEPYTKLLYRSSGVYLDALLEGTAFDASSDVLQLVATDDYAVSFDPARTYSNGSTKTTGYAEKRNAYPELLNGSSEGAAEVRPMLAWASTNSSDADPVMAGAEKSSLTLNVGQLAFDDMNNSLYNKNLCKVQAGNAIEETALTIGEKAYTRADLLMMDFAEGAYSYSTKSGERTDAVRGIPFSVLLAGYDDDDVVSFEAADGYPVGASGMTVAELIDGNYMLAYEANGSGIYETAKGDASKYGFLTMYGDGAKPSKMVNRITVEKASGIDFEHSEYKHITNGGIEGQDGPYNIDSITGATLTIEGPGMKTSTPLSVKDLENQNAGCARGEYSDTRDGSDTVRTYEGVDLYYILHNMENDNNGGIKMTDKAYNVLIKNRNRQTIASLTLDEIEKMHNDNDPAMVAYGTSDGTNTRPFVFDGATGEDKTLGNGDGCLKFVYDKAKYGGNENYTKFGNMAYIYVEEQATPGYKHDKAPYDTAQNSQYVLTLTGDELGKEVNFTVEQLEDMVKYDNDGKIIDNGYGYRDEYSLANSSYWYVNEYEGVKLWSLLQHAGIDAAKASDDSTKVTFKSTDNYGGFDSFSLKQIADPDSFGFYEKNAADKNDGTYEPNENIRQGDDVTTGDKIRTGYPVLVSYGVNEYPYVVSKNLDGYLSGLSNDGGPLRVISGKTEYNHANGSNQAKLIDKVIVGSDENHYSTHAYQPSGSDYAALKDSALKVNVSAGGKDTQKNYTVEDIEKIIYGGSLTATQLKSAKVKDFYEVSKNGNAYSDLYEGINLNYFIKEVMQLQGSQGTITFTDASGKTLTKDIEEVLNTTNGYNDTTKLEGLVPVIAFAKNGYPLVTDKTSAGYVKNGSLNALNESDATSYTVQNNGGPLKVIFPRADKTSAVGDTLDNIVSIDVNLEADKYAHVGAPYDTYADSTLTVTGEGTRLTEAKEFKVSDLEGKQALISTANYSLRNNRGEVNQQRYRGISLYDFLKSTDVGLKSNADVVKIYTSDSTTPVEYSLSEIKNDYLNTVTGDKVPVMLAYGSAAADNSDVKDGKPLVSTTASEGYDAAYNNEGGPLRFVRGQSDASEVNKNKCLRDVVKIEVTAGEQTSWNHSSAEVFKQYLDNTITVKVVDKDGAELEAKTLTVAELEAMTDIISQEEINSTSVNKWEGLNFWQFIQKEFKDTAGIADPISIKVTAKDNFAVDVVEKAGLDGLKNGVKDGDNYVPVMLAYAVDGYPLVTGGKNDTTFGEGYDSTMDNRGGPIRLMVHNAQGACLMEVADITIKVGDAAPQPEAKTAFTVNGVEDGALTVDQLKALTATEKEYAVKGGTDKVRGVMLKDVLASLGITDEDAAITIDADGYGGDGTYTGITLKNAIDENYIVAYEVYNADTASWEAINDTNKTPNSVVRIYRNYLENHPDADQTKWYNKVQFITGVSVSVADKTEFDQYEATGQQGALPLAGLRSTSMDSEGNLWIGTYGGGLVYKAKDANSFITYNKATPTALNSATVSAVCADSEGGVWFSQNGSYSDPSQQMGVGYMKNGEITYYRADDETETIPNDYVQDIKTDKDGNVWFASFGGLTKYDPKDGTWQTWTKEDGFPAESVSVIEPDGKGGLWLGFYPDSSASDGSEPFNGGFAYFKDGAVVKSFNYTSKQDAKTGQYRLGDVWVRDIAVAKDGSAWVVASGSYKGMDNVGGTVWQVSGPEGEAIQYTGYDLIGKDLLDGADNSELRKVAVDPDGGLWFGSSADGIFYVADPTVTAGTMTVTAQYSKDTKSWSADNMDNVYSLDFNGTVLYAGSAAGMAVHEFDFAGGGDAEPPIGDADAETAALTVTGEGVARNGYFSIKGLKNAEGINKTTATFGWMNKKQATGETTIEGDTLENIIKNVVGMPEGKDIDKVVAVCADGYEATYTADQLTREDLKGNKAMLAWQMDGAKCDLTVTVGQFAETDVNKSLWASNVVKLVVYAKDHEEEILPAGDATAETANLTITGDALSRDGYFTIKGIKNTDGIDRVDAEFNWQNSSGTTGSSVVQGATLENIISYIGLAKDEEVGSVEAISADGRTTEYTADQIYTEDLQGNKAMFIWTEGADKVTKTIVGQFEAGQVNRGKWAKDVTKIIVHAKAKADMTKVEEVIAAIEAIGPAEEITIDSADAIAAARTAYNELTDAEKAEVNNYADLEAAEAAIDPILRDAFADKTAELIEDLDLSDYPAVNQLNLWLAADRISQEMDKAETAAEADALYQELQDIIATAKTEAQVLKEKLDSREMNLEASADSYDKITLTWDAAPGAEVYEIYRAEAEDGDYEMIKTTAAENYTDTVSEAEKTYFYKVRALAMTSKNVAVYGENNLVSAKTALEQPKITSISRAKTSLTVKWDKAGGAKGYVLYRATKKNGTYKKVKTITDPSTLKYTNKKLKRHKTYYYKLQSYTVVDDQTIYSTESTIKSRKTK